MDTVEGPGVARAWCLVFLLGAAASGCSGGRDGILGLPDGTGPAPTVTSVAPADEAEGVALNITFVSAAFSEPMAPMTAAATFTLTCVEPCTSPTGTVALDTSGMQASFTLTPATELESLTLYTATLTDFRSLATGVPLAAPFVWSFTTGLSADTTAPRVSSTSPRADETGVAFNSLIAVSFSEPMDPRSISAASIELACPTGTPIVGIVGYVDGDVATLTPAGDLPAGTTCAAAITTGVEDVAGNALAGPFEWTFTTGAAPDSTAPSVSSTSPGSNIIGIALNTLVTASFNEPIDPQTISTTSFALECPTGTPVAASVDYAVSGNVATLTPAADLPPGTMCTATITTAVEDVAHNPMAAAHTWQFVTGAAPDVTAPLVSSTSPPADATGIAFNSLVTASFSEPMDPATITTASFTLDCPTGASVAGTVGYAVIGNVATWTPTGNLPASAACTATITTDVEDDARNPMAIAFNWSFTTGAAPDTTAPTVISTNPFPDETGVATSSYIMADFSEPMDPLTITQTSFTLACPAGTPIASTVGYAVNSINPMLMPTGDLPASTICTAAISIAVTDVAHNALATAHEWSFTTGLAPDTTAPLVDSTNPADNAIGVCTNKTINATFSEAMDPFTITTATFTLDVAPSGSVAGVVTYDDQTNIATFEPSANLTGAPATVYTATIVGGPEGVRDLAGNTLLQDKVTTFATNASTCTTSPALGAASPFGGFGGDATLTNDGLDTRINGDIGVNAASTSITGLRDSANNLYAVSLNNDGFVNGLIYSLTAPPDSVPGDAVTKARADALAAFNSLSPANLPGGIDMANLAQCPSCGGAGDGAGELAGRTLPPGVYLSATGTFDLAGAGHTPGNLTLDAGGDTNAVWVFQTTALTGTLNVGLTGPAPPAVPIQVLLINGAKPENVFWYVPAGAVIGTGSTLAGTVLANAAITISTTGGTPPTAPITTVNGRVISLAAGVTMTNAVINVPAP